MEPTREILRSKFRYDHFSGSVDARCDPAALIVDQAEPFLFNFCRAFGVISCISSTGHDNSLIGPALDVISPPASHLLIADAGEMRWPRAVGKC
jgi:hypothetical protein